MWSISTRADPKASASNPPGGSTHFRERIVMDYVISRAHRVVLVLIDRAELVFGTVAASLFVWAAVWLLIRIP
jgi:hypothetical protein